MDDWTVRRIVNEEKNKPPDGCAVLSFLFLVGMACYLGVHIIWWRGAVDKRLEKLEQKAGIVKEQP